jgi:hypothetical protein
MKNTKLGTSFVGNFSADQSIGMKEIIHINKRNNVLFAKTAHSEIKLLPEDEQAEFITQNFSSFLNEDNESIYTVNIIKTNIVIILYMFKSIQRIEMENETQYFYLDRLETNRLRSKNRITRADEIDFLKKEFLDGRSVFVIEEYQGKLTNKFQIFGNNFIARCERERPGVIKIASIREDKANNRNSEITQWFGNIKFVKFDDAMQISGNDITRKLVQTDDIFLAWNQYLDFKKKKSDDDIREKGFLRFKKKLIANGELTLYFDKEVISHPLFDGNENDNFDIVIYEDPSAINDNIEDILLYKARSYKNTMTVGQCHEIDSDHLKFDGLEDAQKIPQQGIIILSDRNAAIEQRRRKDIINSLSRHTNPTANMIMRLTAGEKDTQTGGDINPITADVLDKMFGDKNFKITENYREAMNIAINTPDLALIQGPPGTGKTTLIKGIVARLNSLGNKNYKILVSSEQHEALFNVVEKISANKLIPPFISSRQYNDDKKNDEDESKFESNVMNFQKELINHCDELLKDKIDGVSDYSSALSEVIYSIQKIRSENYFIDSIKKYLSSINNIVIKNNFGDDTKEIIRRIYEEIATIDTVSAITLLPTEKQRLIKKIESQRLSIESYHDDGEYQLLELQRVINKKSDWADYKMDARLLEKMQSGNDNIILSVFDDYIKYVEYIKDNLLPHQTNEFGKEKISLRELFDKLMVTIQDHSKNRNKDFYDIVEELKYKIMDTDNVITAVKRYTNIIGSTCAQAARSIDKTELSSSAQYDYVIIDEAARANPLDIMIPIMLGTRVILVGDQMQLPHFIETKLAREFTANQSKQFDYDGKLLEKSLFGLIYERVEKSWNEKKLVFKRHIRINEQHRMHPVIGDFISKKFYNGTIMNGIKTNDNTNTFSVYDGKNIVWLNVPITAGLEEGKPSYYRKPEVTKIIDILKDILYSLNGQEPTIGIISFYKKQVDIISKKIKDDFPQEIVGLIDCNTVDSFQGKEFDIVILSTVRSNVSQTAGESLGFIHYGRSRINVALSRAKRLLILVGDADTFARNDIFSDYIKYVKEAGYYG